MKYPQRFGKLSPDDIEAIRSLIKQRQNLRKYLNENLTNEVIAAQFGVAANTITKVARREIYSAVL